MRQIYACKYLHLQKQHTPKADTQLINRINTCSTDSTAHSHHATCTSTITATASASTEVSSVGAVGIGRAFSRGGNELLEVRIPISGGTVSGGVLWYVGVLAVQSTATAGPPLDRV